MYGIRHHMKAKSILQTKVILKNRVIVEMKIWQVPKDIKYPTGYKYSLYAVYNQEILVGYDNHYPKGHHRHMDGQEEEYNFTDIRKLINDFKSDVETQSIKAGL